MSKRGKKRRTSTPAIAPPSKIPRIPLWHWFLVSSGLPLVLLSWKLNLDLWEDEIYTLTEFASKGPWQIVTDYSNTNNHVLYSLLIWPFCAAGQSTFMLRLPSLVSAAGTLWLVFRLARRFGGLPAAIAATATLGMNLLFLVYAIQVRGYSLSMLLTAALANLALTGSASKPRLRFVTIALSGAALLYVMPTNALFFLPLAAISILWAAMTQSKQPAPDIPIGSTWQWRAGGVSPLLNEAAAWLAAAVLAALCYLPICRQLFGYADKKGDWHPISGFFAAASHDVAWLAPFWAAGVFCWFRRVGRRPSLDDVALPMISLGVAASAFALTTVLRVSPFVRNYMPLVPLLALGAGWSIAELLEALRRPVVKWIPSVVSCVAAFLIVMGVLAPSVASYPERLAEACRNGQTQDGYFNYYAADYRPSEVVVKLAELTSHDAGYMIVYAKEDRWNLFYHLDHAGLKPSKTPPSPSSPTVLYAVVPEAAHWDELAKELKIPVDELRAWPMVGDFGYYKVYRSKAIDDGH
jgi:hypothetical protein